MQYRYSLEKGVKKHLCPKCQKKTYVRYLDTHTGDYLDNDYGRCDREQKCAYHNTPKGDLTNTFEITYTPPPPTSYHPYDLVSKSGRNFKQNNFFQFLTTLFTKDEVKSVILRYLIGTSKLWNGATVFWQMDEHQLVRHGKIMLYDATTGKRKKNDAGKAYISSVRSAMKIKDHNLKQCLFGMNLIKEFPDKIIGLVESEKTAILMSIFKDEYVWLATGSKQGFKYEMLKALRGRQIIAFPDKSEYGDWQSKAINLNSKGITIKVSDWLEQMDVKEGYDLADLYLDERSKENTPVAEPLKETRIVTKTESVIMKMSKINPAIKNLIKTFELTDCQGMEIVI